MPPARVLITGAGGFVGGHLIAALRGHFVDADILATALRPTPAKGLVPLDVTDVSAVRGIIAEYQPTHVVHLAALSTLAAAAADDQITWQVHVRGTLNIAHAILESAPTSVLLFVGSGEVYGGTALAGYPLDEGSVLAPLSEYAVTKAAADLALGAMVQKGLRSIRLRPFNHTGPGQSDRFVVPSFARQIVEIEAGRQEPVLRVGNLDAERDFLDARDVVAAYVSAVARADDLAAGVILNIASGEPVRIRHVLDRLLALSSCSIRVEQDPSRMRASDIPRYVGDARRARSMLNWAPGYQLDETLQAVLDWYRVRP